MAIDSLGSLLALATLILRLVLMITMVAMTVVEASVCSLDINKVGEVENVAPVERRVDTLESRFTKNFYMISTLYPFWALALYACIYALFWFSVMITLFR